jgi:hypothetical protein
MPSSGILGYVALAIADASEERIVTIFRVTRIGIILLRGLLQLLVSADDIPTSPIVVTFMMEAIIFSKTSVTTRATRRNIPEEGIL